MGLGGGGLRELNEMSSCQTFHRYRWAQDHVSLENAFWHDLKNIAHAQQATLSELVARIDETRERGNLSSAIRLFVLEHFSQ